jgi:hypothetical protein
LIIGSSADGNKITLYKCFLKNKKTHWSNIGINTVQFTFISSIVFIGTHFTSIDQITFNEMSVRFAHLDEWVDISGFEVKPIEIEIKYTLPKNIEFIIDKEFTIKVGFNVSYPTFSKPLIEISLKQSAWVFFCPSTSRTIDEYLKMMFVMQNFLTLAMSEPTYLTAVVGKTESEKFIVGDKEIHTEIDVLFKQQSYVLEPIHPLRTREMLFTLKQILTKQDVLGKWFNKSQVLEPVYDLYFGTFYQKGMYLNNELLNLAQALESYHRKTMENLELPIEQHQNRVNEILKNTPEVYKEWLKNKLKYTNEPTLRKRLRELWDKCPPTLTTKFGTKELFVGITVDTRNYLTHFGDDLKANAATSEDLYTFVLKLRIMVQICLLQELGFNSDEVTLLMSKQLKENGF